MRFKGRLLLLFLTFSAVARGGDLKAHAAVMDITPPLSMQYTLGGYGERMNKPAEAIHDPIKAKAVLFKSGKQHYAVVTLDLLGLPGNVKPMLIERLHNPIWNQSNILLLPSHSHGSLEMAALNSKNVLGNPNLGIFQPELLQFLLDKLETLFRLADREYVPVKVGTGQVQLEGLNRNRRKDPEVDRELTVTRIDRYNGKPLVVLVNWTAHPTFISGRDMKVSAEWPGYLQSDLEALIGNGVIAMYYNGAEGDQSTVMTRRGDAYDQIQAYGKLIAEKVYPLYQTIVPRKKQPIQYGYQLFPLPEHKAHPSFMKTGGEEYGLNEQSVKIVMDVLGPKEVGIGAVRIGDLLIAAVPGELTAELGLVIKDKLRNEGIAHPVIGGLANEWISYILSKKQYLYGEGYESSVSFYGPNLGEVITQGVLETATPLTKPFEN